jgi:citrate lyase subunit beta/citryl-CoA lyase
LQLKKSGGIAIRLTSKVERIFGNQIRKQILEVLGAFQIKNAEVEVDDSGALPFVIAARIESAVQKLQSSDLTCLPEIIPENIYETERDRFRFSRLYLPGNTPSMMLNAGIHHPDGIILDLEDSVAPERKGEARLLVRNALRQVNFYGAERMVRINQLPAGIEDLEAIVPHYVHLLLIPKVEQAGEVKEVEKYVTNILSGAGQSRRIFFMPIIETCLGVENAYEIARSSELNVAMAIGLEDYTADLGVMRSRSGEESFYARSRLVNACKAAGIQPIDSVFSDVSDTEGLLDAVKRSKALGFEGMGCIHPRQVTVIHQGFAPDEQEVERAEKIIRAFETAKSKGLGVISVGTKMIDPPVVKRAQRTMELAYRFGIRERSPSGA